jgi:acetylornithine deacetylase/succinyl-diaminopimelate desuccinylase-like protein
MTDFLAEVTALAADLVAIDSRSFVSNLAVAERVEAALAGFEVERLDYVDRDGVAKRVLVAHRGGSGGIAFSGHMDTVPDTGWQTDPWSARIEGDVLHGLGSTDMKGPVAAIITAARALPEWMPVTLLITADEETTKAGAFVIAERSELVRKVKPRGIVVAEPTLMIPVRGHRAQIALTAVATGIQAHSSTGQGRNANWQLIPFMMEMKAVYERLRTDPTQQDPDYDPPFSDFNPILDNHGTATNVTVPTATARIKYRYSAKIDPEPIMTVVREAAARHGVALSEEPEGAPPELAADHPFVRLCQDVTGTAPETAPYGTDAAQLQAIAPCVIMGPGTIAVAHKPNESVSLRALADAVPVFIRLAERLAGN